jgi:amino acid transporter
MSGLKKEISAIGLLFTSLSCMIGSGWLLSSVVAAKIAGPAAILSWLIGGILICFIAVTFAELSTAFPVAGGIARYGQFSHGSCVSFIISFLAWLSCVAVAPTEAQAIIQYTSRFFEGLTYKSGNTVILTNYGLLIASLIVFTLTWINTQGIKAMIRYNNILTIWKIFVPIFVLITLYYHRFSPENFTEPFMPFGIEGVFSALSTTVVFSYIGFREATSLAAEVKNPQKAIPIACIGSILYCMIFYVVMQSVFVGAVDQSMLSNGWNMLSFPHDSGPFAGLAIALGIHWLATIVYIDAAIAPAGAGLVYTATTSRLLLAMSQNGFLPNFFSKLNKEGVPQNALYINAIVGLILLIPFNDWVALVKFQSVAIIFAYAIGPVSLIVLRETLPNIKRPFKLPMVYLCCQLSLFICLLLVYWSGFDTVAPLCISILVGFSIYCTKVGFKEISHAIWLIPLMLSILITSYLGNYGGIGYLSSIQDIILLFCSSIFILKSGIKSKLDAKLTHHYLNDTNLTYYDAI